jgi:ribonuclease BN (tRNA processing enzyme)
MRVEFFGTAGFHPNAERHTAGIFIPDAAPGEAFLLDAGTGTWRLTARDLPSRLHIFLTHAHLDHVAGLTYLLDVVYGRELEITIYGDAKTLDAARSALFGSPLFPLKWSYATCEIAPGTPLQVAGVEVSAFLLNHPDGCLALRFGWPQKSLAYVTDTVGDDGYFEFIRGVDLLIHERNFPDHLSELAKASGHCTSSDLVRAARASGAKQVVATHFNPLTTTDPLLEDDVYPQIPGVISACDELLISF